LAQQAVIHDVAKPHPFRLERDRQRLNSSVARITLANNNFERNPTTKLTACDRISFWKSHGRWIR
jgi:hypothetical protein